MALKWLSSGLSSSATSLSFCVCVVLYLPVYKLTFYSLKIGPKNSPWHIHGSKTEISKRSGQIFRVTIAYHKESSKIKDKFFEKILTPKSKKNLFFGSKMGGWLIQRIDLYMGTVGGVCSAQTSSHFMKVLIINLHNSVILVWNVRYMG